MFIRITACSLADSLLQEPFAPRASGISLLPCPPRLLPAGAKVAGWVYPTLPLEFCAFVTAHSDRLLVLTQSCDLARREGKPCNARYVTIAAVRPVRTAIERKIQELQHTEIERRLGFCSKDRQAKLTQFMERLLNNNEEDYFYLHREPSIGLIDDHCAFLQLSIALKVHLHYGTLLAARILSLKESFQHKLGYLVGSLYSRVGTEDWLEKQQQAIQFQELTQQPTKDPALVIWLEKHVHKKVVDILNKLPDPSPDDLQQAIAQAFKSKETRKREVLSMIASVLSELQVPEEIVTKATTRLENSAEFTIKFK
jgi:hypothetical protein